MDSFLRPNDRDSPSRDGISFSDAGGPLKARLAILLQAFLGFFGAIFVVIHQRTLWQKGHHFYAVTGLAYSASGVRRK
jgi:hypothetical protein